MSEFKAARLARSYVQTIEAPPEHVFPLLCPVRERDWLDGWDFTMVHSRSSVAEEGCIFTTGHHGAAETVWSITRHEAPTRVAFFRVTPGSMAVDIDIVVEPLERARSRVTIAYTYTALSESGASDIGAMTEADWVRMMDFWERSMNHYLRTGEKLSLVAAD